jgi:hypothetical protein
MTFAVAGSPFGSHSPIMEMSLTGEWSIVIGAGAAMMAFEANVGMMLSPGRAYRKGCPEQERETSKRMFCKNS